MPIERILITVKTYPTLSEKYSELACTAGLREDGSWIRLYPVPFRMLQDSSQYKKYHWIEAKVSKSTKDSRPESFKIDDIDAITLSDYIDTKNGWWERRKFILDNVKVYQNTKELITLAHENKVSLALFKPTKFIDFVCEPDSREWDKDRLKSIENRLKNHDMFSDPLDRDFKLIPKLPYKFYFIFEDNEGTRSRLMIEDWEIGSLYWNCLKGNSEAVATQKVKDKFFNDFALTKDLYFYLGTTKEWHVRKARNPYVIIGTLPLPEIKQYNLL